MTKFRTKSVIVEAMQMPQTKDFDAVHAVAVWMVDNGYFVDCTLDHSDIDENFLDNGRVLAEHGVNYLNVDEEEGWGSTAYLSDWVIRGVDGGFSTCRDYVFEEIYEPVEED